MRPFSTSNQTSLLNLREKSGLARWILGFRDPVLQFLVLLHFVLRLRRISLPAVEICQPEMRLRGERGFLLEFAHSGRGFFGRSRVPVQRGGFSPRIPRSP